ncbi:N-acetyltransferase [Pseudomonas sp. R5(2019)]|uniref:GNAT family N-acetyltransferase n=1 Tax=Pseudomonas sp. R5(2019) TaxID=2697566 RepID=UPI001412E630|nr:GNAT family N-acetyltransferase [Pseudomonas sp. R5(2019)]NBA93485.1 GNAT family N-acetyltransferase [Pseudomonas sp. R5(2019)]
MSLQLVCHSTLTRAQQSQLQGLELSPEQQAFAGDVHSALYLLNNGQNFAIRGFVLLVDQRPVAFLLLKRPPYLPPWADENSATLHAFMVDQRQQGKGYGKACLQALPAAAKQAWPELAQLMLSVDLDNLQALALYRRQGWEACGHGYRGRSGHELRMRLPIAP